MKDFWKVFWGAFVSTAGVVGAYVGLSVAGYEWAFWIVLGVSLCCALGWWYVHSNLNFGKRLKDYPRLLLRVTELESDVTEAEAALRELQEQLQAERTKGAEEGRRQILGALAAKDANVPELRAIATVDEEVAFLCSGESGDATVGARYFVVSSKSDKVRGVVELQVLEGATSDSVYLRCVETTVPGFWQQLAERVDYDDSLPPDIELRPYEYGGEAIAQAPAEDENVRE